MAVAHVFVGAFLFALLTVDVHCRAIKKESGPGSPSDNVAVPSHQPEPLEPSFSQPVYRRPATPVGSRWSSKPSGRPGSLKRKPATSTQPGAALQTGPGFSGDWIVEPLSRSRDKMSAGSYEVSSRVPEAVSSPGSTYQPGALSHYEGTYEEGNYEGETEERGDLLPHPPSMYKPAKRGFQSLPQPNFGYWYPLPYYYDYMFLTGQYPPGTVSHSSINYEQGSDSWHDSHYVRDYLPYNSAPEQQMDTTDFVLPMQPVMAGYEEAGAQPLPAAGQFEAATHSQPPGYNMGKVQWYPYS